MPRITYREFEPYSPLDERELATTVRRRLEEQEREPVPPAHFRGAGLYALYYRGPSPVYARLTGSETPISIGRSAVGAGRFGTMVWSDTTKLRQRINEHARSIRSASNLELEDFECRFLVTGDAWIALGEGALLSAYHPVLWNTLIDGFGNHGQGAGRDEQVRSKWDTLHPGRSAPKKLKPNPLSVRNLENRVQEALDAASRGERVDVEIADGDI